MKVIKEYIFTTGIFSGVMVGIGDIAMMSIKNPYIAALCFSLALLSIIELRCNLYTGMIGKIIKVHSVGNVLVALGANTIGCCLSLILYCFQSQEHYKILLETANNKFNGTNFLSLFVAGFMCGVLIHVAVTAKKTTITILSIMVFILCGFRHSIADVGYAIISLNPTYIFLWFGVLLGNTLGSIFTDAALPDR